MQFTPTHLSCHSHPSLSGLPPSSQEVRTVTLIVQPEETTDLAGAVGRLGRKAKRRNDQEGGKVDDIQWCVKSGLANKMAVNRWLILFEKAIYRRMTRWKQNCRGLSECEHTWTTLKKKITASEGKKNQILFTKHFLPGTARISQSPTPQNHKANVMLMNKGTACWQN